MVINACSFDMATEKLGFIFGGRVCAYIRNDLSFIAYDALTHGGLYSGGGGLRYRHVQKSNCTAFILHQQKTEIVSTCNQKKKFLCSKQLKHERNA